MSPTVTADPAAAPSRSRTGAEAVVSARALVLFSALLVATQVAQLLLRGQGWTIDTRWAISQYLLGMVLFGPLVTAFAAWQGRALGGAAWLVRARPWRGLAMFLAPALVIATVVFLGGLLAAVGAALADGAPLAVSASDGWGVVAALLGVWAHAALGLAAGARFRSRLVPALSAAAVFAVTMTAWIGGGRVLVDFGGATGGVIGLQATTGAQVSRLVLMALLTAVGLIAARSALGGGPPAGRTALAWLTAGAVATVAVGLSVDDGYRSAPERWACEGTSPQLCVPARFDRLLPDLDAAMRSQGLAAQVTGASPNAGSRIEVEDSLLLVQVSRSGRDAANDPVLLDRIGALVYNELIAPGCLAEQTFADEMSPEAQAAFDTIIQWVTWQTAQQDPSSAVLTADDLGVPDVVIGSPGADEFLAVAIGSLPSCP